MSLIDSLLKPTQLLVGKPQTLLPGLVTGILAVLLLFFSMEFFAGFVYQLIVLDTLPSGSPIEIWFQLVLQYPLDWLQLLLTAGAFFVVLVWHVFVSARMVVEDETGNLAVAHIMKESASRVGEIILLGVFMLLMLGLAEILLLVGWGFLVAVDNFWVWLFLVVGGALAGIYVYIMVMFVPFVMGIEQVKLKEALQKSWEFASRRVWQLLLVVAGVGIVTGLLNAAGIAVMDAWMDDAVALIVFWVLYAVSVSYSNIAFAHYYATHNG